MNTGIPRLPACARKKTLPFEEVKSCSLAEGNATLWNADCEGMTVYPQAQATITDPPYEIGNAWKRSFHGKNGKSPLWGTQQAWDKLSPLVAKLPEMYDICVVWGGNFYPLPPSRCWFVWDKLQSNRGADCELAWVQADLPPKVFRMSRIDAYVNKSECKKTHPTQKPTPLMEWCISNLKLPPGSTIFDPFMGTGTTGVAAINLGMRFVGIELDPAHYDTATKRIAAAWAARTTNLVGQR